MCGIAGKLVINPFGNCFKTVSDMCQIMAHRGPDNQGVEKCGNFVLGHRRLSIIDLSEDANMPMFSDDEQYCITYNGEFYNFKEVREELEKKGYFFKTNSDTEVLLKAYIEYKEECLNKINGMFAFAIWDNRSKSLFLARDRFGQKPLFYHKDNKGNFSFASELKAFKVDNSIDLSYSVESINTYLALGYILNPATQYEQVYSLEPATYMYLDSKANIINKVRYWDYNKTFDNKIKRNEKIIAEELNEYLRQAVYRRMISDVPVGSFLSGGIDSSTIVSFMKEKHKGELHTFSVGFEQKSYSELEDADKVAAWIQTKHHGIIVGKDNHRKLLNDSLKVFDELFSDNSLIPMVEVSKLASQYVKVVLSGDAGDELFGGYITYKADKLLPWAKMFIPRFLRNELSRNRKIISSKKIGVQFKMQQFLYGSKYDFRKAHYSWRLIYKPEERVKILGEKYRELVYDTDPLRKFMDYYKQVSHLDELDQHLYVDAMTWLTDDILVKVDRSSMASSIEARAPFLDIDLVNYASSIPSDLKLNKFNSKYILKKALINQIPDFSIHKKKSGFNSPVNMWIDREESNEFQDFNKYVLNNKLKNINLP